MKLAANAAVSISILIASQMAQAQDTYVAISGGQTEIRKFCDGIMGSCDNKGTGFKAFIGHNFTPYVGAEFGYVDFGKATATDVSFGIPINVKAKSYALGGSLAVC